MEGLRLLDPGTRRDLLRVADVASQVRADVIRQFHELGNEGMVDALVEMEADEPLRRRVIEELRRADGPERV